MEPHYRAPTALESAIVRRILSVEQTFSALLAQVQDMEVATLDEYGSIAIRTSPGWGPAARGRLRRISPVGRCVDADGVPIEFLLFASGGLLVELEILRVDGGPILAPLRADALEVDVLPPTKLPPQ
jgi:hypothetical protein